MDVQQSINYQRIEAAIDFYRNNIKEQPSLESAAAHVHLSPFHFQRMFKEWAGVTPKQFLQYLSLCHAKEIMKVTESTLFDVAFETGLSGTSRLHDLFIKIEGMTPGEYKNGGEYLTIHYSFAETPFGMILVASTAKGICHMAFADGHHDHALQQLVNRFPNGTFKRLTDVIQQKALFIFTQDWSKLDEIKLHLKGTAFQIKVWETLLKIPFGKLTTYSSLANLIEVPKAARAVGSAVGDNPVAFLVPCHRVIKSTGEFGQYHWGSNRKSAIIGWESAQQYHSI